MSGPGSDGIWWKQLVHFELFSETLDQLREMHTLKVCLDGAVQVYGQACETESRHRDFHSNDVVYAHLHYITLLLATR